MEKPARVKPAKTENKETENLSNGKKWLKWVIEYRFVLIVLVILIQNLIYVVYVSSGLPGDDIIGICTGSLMMIFCVLAVSKDRRSLRIGLTWGVLSIVTAPLIVLFNAWPLVLIYLSFILYTTVVIVYSVVTSKEISINIIFGSIAGFLLIGIIGAIVCQFLEIFHPGSFTMAQGMEDPEIAFFYFSIITMTSLGYGDIIPATDIARTISAYLVLFGQLYLAIQVAVLVGKLIKGSDSTEKERKKEIEDLKAQIRLLKSESD